jgi:hypothetical protein
MCPYGSADFDMGFLREVGPVVSIISPGELVPGEQVVNYAMREAICGE